MRRFRDGISLVLFVWAMVVPLRAAADDMSVSLSRLRIAAVEGSACDTTVPGGGARAFCPDNRAFASLMSQLGMSMAPPVLTPARSLGYGRFHFALEGWLSGIKSNADYWQRGTEGSGLTGIDGRNRLVDSVLFWSRISVRKGLPLGFEIGGSAGRLTNSDLWTFGLEVKWALFEGYRTGWGMLPDVAVRGAVQTMAGDQEFTVTVPTFDVIVSKPFTLFQMAEISPFAAFQTAWILANSDLVDLTPDVNAFDQCQPEPGGSIVRCQAGENGRGGDDFNNNAVFESLEATRMRLAFGVQGRYEAITVAASVLFDVRSPDADANVPAGVPRQWTVAASAGVAY